MAPVPVELYLESELRPFIKEFVGPVVESRAADPQEALFCALAKHLGKPYKEPKDRAKPRAESDKAFDAERKTGFDDDRKRKQSTYKRESVVANFFGDKSENSELSSLFEATKRITNEIVPQKTCHVIVDEVQTLLNCVRVALFVADERNKFFKLFRTDKEAVSRVPFNKGLVGYSYSQKRSHVTTNIKSDNLGSLYDSKIDLPVIDAPCMLTFPVLDYDNDCLGIIQATSKKPFTERIRLLIHQVSQHCAIALRNAAVFREAVVQHERSIGLLNVAKTLSQDLNPQDAIATIATNAAQLVQSEHCYVYLVDHQEKQFWTISDDGTDVVHELTWGLPGKCFETKTAHNVTELTPDIPTELADGVAMSALAVPVMAQTTSGLLGVVVVLNKTEVDGSEGEFDLDDVDLLGTFSTYVSGEIEASGLVKRRRERASESGVAVVKADLPQGRKSIRGVAGLSDEARRSLRSESM